MSSSSTCQTSGVDQPSRSRRRHSAICIVSLMMLSSVIPIDCQETNTAPSQSFMSAQERPRQSISGGSQLVPSHQRQSKQAEEEDGFIMKTQQASRQDEEVTTTTTTQTSEQVTTVTPPPLIGDNDGDRIAINASRPQFLTHDQLLTASTKDEQIQVQQAGHQQHSRLAMPRLAYASSFLSDFLFGARHPQQQQQQQQPATSTSISTAPSTTPTARPHQQQEPTASCPGVCLNLLVASIRCQHAIAAPCPSLLQKCCEMDDVSFNGTPVETSAPLPTTGDTDSSPRPPPATRSDLPPASRPLDQDEQTPNGATQRPANSEQAPHLPEQQASINSQSTGKQSTSSLSPDAQLNSDEQHLNSRSVYFLSSSGGSGGATTTSGEPEKRVEQQQAGAQLWPAGAQSAGANQARRPNSSGDHTNAGQQQQSRPAQSFDELSTTTSAPATTAFSSPPPATSTPRDRLVLIQTANGTTYLQHSSDATARRPIITMPRPLYANWTDYQLLMMQSRPPANSSPVLYHSNTDPVRKYAGVAQQHDDLNPAAAAPNQNLSQPVTQRPRPHTGEPTTDEPTRVLKDQHSSRTTTEISTTTTSTTTIPTTTTTPEVGDTPTTTTQTPTPNDELQSEQSEQQSMPVSGIANFLGSLFDTFISSPPAGADQQPPTQMGVDEMMSSPDDQQQHNDRRLGLDLSFRQPNDQSGVNGSGQPEVDSYQDQRCQGYCSLDQFLHLCDSHYPSSDCARSQKCCVTAPAAEQSPSYATTATTTTTTTRQQQVCRGACLPIYHSSLCLKPNEIQLDSPSCLPNQFCCSQVSQLIDSGNNYLDTATELAASSSTPAADHFGLSSTTSGQVHDGSLQKDHSLTVALLPPPPPTVTAPPQQQSISGRHVMQAASPNYQANRQVASTQQPPSGGIMNQLFQMFKSNTGLGKQRPKASPPTQPAMQPAYYQQQPQIVYELAPSFQQMATNGRPSPGASNNQVVSFPGQPFANVNPRQQQQLINGQFTLEQMAQFYQTDPSQLASLLNQRQFNGAPNRPQQQVATYQPIEQQQLMSAMASNQQHKVVTYAPAQQQQQQQQQLQHQRNQQMIPNYAQNTNNQRWTHLNENTNTNNNNNNNAQLRPQPQIAYSQPQQKVNQRPVGGNAQFAFGPADAAINNAQQEATIRQPQQLTNNKPLTNPQFGWTGTNARPEITNNNRLKAPPTPDANIVMPPVIQSTQRPALLHTTQQQVSNWNTGSAGVKLSPLPASQSVIPTSAPSARPNKQPTQQQPLVSAASHLSPIHADNTSGTTDDQDELPVVATPSVSTADDAAAAVASEDEQPQVEHCKWACLAHVLSFKCAHPNYIDSNLSCATPGTVCCVRGNQSTTSTSMSTASTPQEDELKPVSEVVADDQSDLMVSQVATPTPDSNILEGDQQSDLNKSVSTTRVTTACGLPGPSRGLARARQGRVMGGSEAAPGYWCWQAALMNGKNEYLCGGALIGTKWVLTAAHCVTQHLRSESQLFVRLGQWNLNSSSPLERRSARSVLVKTSYVHHNHNGVTLDNDIALLRLDEPVDLSEPSICTVCLPERQQAAGLMEQGKRCTVTGYGFENEQGPAALRVRQTELPIVADAECQNKTSQVLGKPFVLPASSFCAGGELGRDACHGDGGSPLSCLVNGAYELTGIVSWGYKCGNKDLPGLYAKVSNFVGWINQIVSVNS